jgi:DNA-nicking Smr family endonuclease
LSGDYVQLVDPHDVLEFKRPGVQHGVYKNLRLGKYLIEARLDLHRLSVEQARTAVAQFARDCVDNSVRCALITHGKGVDRQPQPALLKSCIAHWLPQLEEVLAFHSAQRQHGGVGSTYVLLRKSEKKRQENFEKHSKRR